MLAIFSIIVVQVVAAEKDQRPPIARMKAAEIEDALHVSLSKPKVRQYDSHTRVM